NALTGLVMLSALLLTADVMAHGEADWNEFKIDNKNKGVATSLAYAREEISDVVMGRRTVSRWPDLELLRLRDQLALLSEEVDDMLNHFREDGIILQVNRSLRENPRAGQAVAGSHALEMCIELLDHMAALDSAAAFADELHDGGIGAYMFDLMDAYAENMALYGEIIHHAHAEEMPKDAAEHSH
ncbi:MAG: hypothetical protein KJO82_03185, partial [Gammaproteobacteria bacterium]|nr:hypothetical protein [Gammaproteobacteria bacterium]